MQNQRKDGKGKGPGGKGGKGSMGPRGKGGRGGKGSKDMTTMLALMDQCTYNFQCESDCCMEPRKKKGKKGRRGDDDDDDDRRLLQKGGRGGRGERGGSQEKRGMTMCQKEYHCDMDRDEKMGMTIWNFFSGLIIGVLMIIAAFQCWYYKR